MATVKKLYLTLSANFTGGYMVQGHPTRFGHVLNNLIGNSATFTHHGGVTVNAQLNFKPEETVLLHISAADTGTGIARDALGKDIYTVYTGLPCHWPYIREKWAWLGDK